MIIKKIKPFSLGRIFGLFYAVIGFVVSLLMFFLFIFEVISQGIDGWPMLGFILFNLFMAFVFGLFSALLVGLWGFVQGYLTALIYNFLAKKAGGAVVVFSLEEEEKKKRLRERWSAKSKDEETGEKRTKRRKKSNN